MKHFISILTGILLITQVYAQNVGIGTNTPHPSARLEVADPSRGFLPPRVALIAANDTLPVAGPATGLLVYNTATSGVAPNNVIPGYYYWNGTKWYPVVNKGNAFGDMQYWNGTNWVMIPIGPNGSVLTVCNGIPTWGPCPSTTVTISPANNPYEGAYLDFAPSVFVSPHPQILIEAWTNGGAPFTVRACVRFDLSSIPPGAVIDSARLYLYADPAPVNGNLVNAMFGPANLFLIQRITSTWTLPTPFTWNNQPTITTANQVIVPQSNSSFENTSTLVTQLVNDMIQFGNNGFHMKLVTETTYNSRQYLSSTYSDPTKRPKLVITYH
ncbi:MAG: DNRLRE domain-containing protein [Chitinophagaceae bacterium]|nr:DNRLRE domain-containing protein [Chitinophagaceae bacterium]